MNFDVLKSQFLEGIQTVQNIAGGKSKLPILSNILLETSGNRLNLTATNLEISIKSSLSAQIKEKGAITLPVKKLSEIIRELPEAEINLKKGGEGNNVIIKCEKSTFNLLGLPKEEFPSIPEFKDKFSFKINPEILKNMVRKTKFAISTDETRQALNGVYFILDYTELRMVATDGRRLAYIRMSLPNLLKEKKAVIIPGKALNELNRIIGDKEVKVNLNDNQIAFQLNDTILISRLIEGHFPNYEQVIPKKQEKKIKVGRNNLLRAVRRISLLANEKTNSLRIKSQNNKLIITASSPEVGEAQEEVESSSQGKEIEIIFNAYYLLDILNNIDSEEVLLELNDPLTPGIIRPVGEEDYLCVIMPMKP